jgi:DNA polymerase-3 subunit epsilon
MKTVALDVEIASSYETGSICAIGLCVIEDSAIVWEYETLVNPDTPFDPFCMSIHGITPQLVRNAPTLKQMLLEISPILDGALMVAHNAPFDHGQLKAAAKRCGVDLPAFSVACTVKLARTAFPGRKTYSLGTLRDLIGMDFVHHDAMWDARACAHLYLRCIDVQRGAKSASRD